MVLAVVLLVVAWLVTAPLRPGAAQRAAETGSSERDELEAQRAAKYSEIRDAELDFRTGKLSEADWRGLDRSLRAEAIEILNRLDEL